MATTRARQLEKLAMSLPQENQQMAQAQQQARMTQLQEQVRQAGPGLGPRAAQELGAQQAAQAGQIQLGAAQQTQQQQQLLGQEALAERAREQRGAGFAQQIALGEQQREAADRLARIDRTLKSRLLDDQLQFRRDQAGQALLNERQMADWAVSKAQSAEEYASYAQAAQQVYERELQMLETANKKITQVLQQNYIKEGKPLDRQLRMKLAQQKKQLELEIQKKQNKAANNAAMWQAGGTIVGGVAGALLGGGPAGAAVGASLGAGLGQIASGLFG